jgi:ATP-dependent exoDNAse (exonuclease V) alpha subunit
LGTDENPLINGMLGTIRGVSYKDSELYNPHMTATFVSDNDGVYDALHMDCKIFTDKEPTVYKENWFMYPKNERAYEFDYGYCITTHKSQGSDFEKVIVYDEWLGDKEFHKKWLYTAITRSSKALVVVK